MLILSIKTDQPEAELALFEDDTQLAIEKWLAHRQLAETIHPKIADLLKGQDKDWSNLQAIVCFKGPGSFTGLRIGLSVANALAFGLKLPIIAADGDTWAADGIKSLLVGKTDKVAMPEYGAPVHITAQKK